jgi:hypothetical protein
MEVMFFSDASRPVSLASPTRGLGPSEAFLRKRGCGTGGASGSGGTAGSGGSGGMPRPVPGDFVDIDIWDRGAVVVTDLPLIGGGNTFVLGDTAGEGRIPSASVRPMEASSSASRRRGAMGRVALPSIPSSFSRSSRHSFLVLT